MARQLKPGYRVDRLGAAVLDDDGLATRTSYGRVDALVKEYDPDTYEIANEYICSRLAAGIGLPVPPGDFAQIRDSDRVCWVSPMFAAETPPPPDVEELCRREARIAAGTVAFDVWVGNLDRHDENILYNARQGVSLIDHGQALFLKGPDPAAGLAASIEMSPGSHLLAPHVKRSQVEEWAATIAAVPKKMIAGAVEPVERLNLVDSAHAKAIVEFLETRARRLRQLLQRIDFPEPAHGKVNEGLLGSATDEVES